MSDIDWTKAPEGATHCEIDRPYPWLRKDVDGGWCFWGANTRDWITMETPNAKRMSSIIQRPTAWTGDGLPPVGAVCEVTSLYAHGGNKVKIVGHDDGTAVARYMSGDLLGSYTAFVKGELVPIRTPEQIAEEERKAAGLELGELYVKGGLIAIYDAGWRPRAKS